ncbi:hypothetical protein CLAIMM_07654 [Cladophialophora immunda]|nr:hypothetical protein CLAIMM_07654 [Cladophialophora immunda]
MEHMRVYQNWFHAKIWQSETSHPLILLPIENMTPRYRDEFPNFRRPPPGVNSIFLSPVLGAPELLVPIDEIPYQSRVTRQEEKLPFVIGLMSLPGTDLLLLEEVHRILTKSEKYHAQVYTGTNMFSKSNT